MNTGIIFIASLGVIFAGAFGLSLVANYFEGDEGINFGGCGTGGCDGSGGGGGGGSCCSSGGSTSQSKQLASDYYIQKTGDAPSDFTVKVKDLGCHHEAKIIKDGNVVMEVSISGGEVTEI